MSLLKLIANYSAYNEWANEEISNCLKKLDIDILYAKTPSSFDSIDYTLQHILRTQKFWLLFICDEDFSHLNWSVRDGEVEEIFQELKEVCAQMTLRFSAFSEEELTQTMHLNTAWAKNNLSRYEYIVHIVNHGSFHRGQIITMARSLGITEGLVNTDYNNFNSRKN